MHLLLKNSLPFVTVTVTNQGKSIEIPDILVDTGSASTILAADKLIAIDIQPEAEDVLHTIRGVGGVEVVFIRKIEFISVGRHEENNFEIEVGGMDYGFEINGILGMDFLTQSHAIIDLSNMQLEFHS